MQFLVIFIITTLNQVKDGRESNLRLCPEFAQYYLGKASGW